VPHLVDSFHMQRVSRTASCPGLIQRLPRPLRAKRDLPSLRNVAQKICTALILNESQHRCLCGRPYDWEVISPRVLNFRLVCRSFNSGYRDALFTVLTGVCVHPRACLNVYLNAAPAWPKAWRTVWFDESGTYKLAYDSKLHRVVVSEYGPKILITRPRSRPVLSTGQNPSARQSQYTEH